MAKVAVLVAVAVCLVGCSSRAGESAFASATKEAGTRTAVRKCAEQAAGVLDSILRNPSSAVPDGVLNRTKCIVVFPAVEQRHLSPGVGSCRDNPERWSLPLFVSFKGSVTGSAATRIDVLVFVLTDNGEQHLRSDQLVLANDTAMPGVLASEVPVVTDAQLSRSALTYGHSAGKVSGISVNGIARIDALAMRAVYPDAKHTDVLNVGAAANDVPAFITSVASFFNTITPSGIIVHHSATIPAEGRVPGSEPEIDKFHAGRGFDITCFGRVYHIAYHYLIFPDGRVQQGRPDRCEGAHAAGYNSYLGISVVGDFSSVDNPTGNKGLERPTRQQIRSLVELCTRLMHEYHIPLQRVLRHSDVSSTRCPGDRFPFGEVLRRLSQAPG